MMNIRSINATNIKTSLKFMVLMPWALLARMWEKDVWIITERKDQARDNGYCFYLYVREKHPEQRIIYIIDKNSSDYNKIKKYNSIVQFNSLAHYYYYCLSKIHISAHVGGCIPSHSPIVRYINKILKIKNVFLPHGVSYGISEFCLKKYSNIDLFICCGKPEYDNVLNNYGYKKNEVALTGFPRLDKWHNINVNKNLILLMPTWRSYIALNPKVNFRNTYFYKRYQELLNDRGFIEFLHNNNLQLLLCLHNDMMKYASAFSSYSSNIKIIQQVDDVDIQEVLKEAALLVTDYSSVQFDFAYMNKPVIYYQFDQEEFFSRQYNRSFFDAEKNGFGKVIYTLDDLIESIKLSFYSNFVLEGEYMKNMRNFYTLYDCNNSKRVFKTIKERMY